MTKDKSEDTGVPLTQANQPVQDAAEQAAKQRPPDVNIQPLLMVNETMFLTATVTATVFRKPPDGHPIYALLGQVSSNWAHLEHKLDQIIWELLPLPHRRTACLTAQMMGHTPRFYTIIALLTEQSASSELTKQADALAGKTSALAIERNRVVHDAWYIEGDDGTPHQHRSMPKDDRRFGIYPKQMEEIRQLIKKIEVRISEIDRLAEGIFSPRA